VTTIGTYRIRRKLGEGGMGAVWLAEDPGGHAVVLKIPLRSTPEIVARMEDEATIGMQLRHAHIVKTLDFFMDDDRPVIVINHIEGTSLRELRDSVGALPAAMIARVGEQISDALSALHHLKDNTGRSLEILHRDVTPGNILVDRQGNACLIDLGIARSVLSTATKTSMGVLRGTFRYISPDLFRGGAYSWMTDLWALGVTLFEAAVGRKAAEGSQHQVFHAITEGHIATLRPGEQLHPALRYLFDGLLEVDADTRRFRDPEDILHAFRVIRGRVGDGEQETINVMKRVHIAMDEEPVVAAPPAPTKAPAPGAPRLSAPTTTKMTSLGSTSITATPATGSMHVEQGRDEFDQFDGFDDQTLVSHASDLEARETTRTVDVPLGPGEGSQRARRLNETVEEWDDHTVPTKKTTRDR
jgi:serine/threonine protein kinase